MGSDAEPFPDELVEMPRQIVGEKKVVTSSSAVAAKRSLPVKKA